MILYADSSALARAYLADEEESGELRALLLESGHAVSTSELALIELAGAFRAAERVGRVPSAAALVAGLDRDLSEEGPVAVIRLRPETVVPRARALVLQHSLGTLDAMHLAVTLEQLAGLAEDTLFFVTRDEDQAAAARALGLDVC